MLKRKYFFLLLIFFLFVSWGEAQTSLSKPTDYEKLFADNLTRGGKVLNLSGKNIGDAGLKILFKQAFIKKLKKLDLRYNDISPNGAETLAQTQPLPKLKTLILKHNFFADEGTVALANSASFPNLEKLQLGWNEVRDAGALALANSKNFPKLKKLDLRGNFLAGKTKETLRSSLSYLKSLRIFQSEWPDLGSGNLTQYPLYYNSCRVEFRCAPFDNRFWKVAPNV